MGAVRHKLPVAYGPIADQPVNRPSAKFALPWKFAFARGLLPNGSLDAPASGAVTFLPGMSIPDLRSGLRASTPQLVRGVIGGVLMGLVNLVPGISGGTMLLAAGVYPQFIQGIAEVTTLRFRRSTLLMLAAIGGSGLLAIIALAGLVKGLVIDHRWVMYSLFIGLTLGGVPVVWRLLRPLTASAAAGAVGGVAVMAGMAWLQLGGGDAGPTGAGTLVVMLAGVAGASAMILPGISGSYLWLIMGQYLTILAAIEGLKTGLLGGGGFAWERVAGSMSILAPLGIGVVVGVVGISNLMRLLMARFEKATLGVLLGLLLGAVLGLWPFQHGVRPEPGTTVKGRVMSQELIAGLEPKDYPLERFAPSGFQVGVSVLLVGVGFLITQGVSFVGRTRE